MRTLQGTCATVIGINATVNANLTFATVVSTNVTLNASRTCASHWQTLFDHDSFKALRPQTSRRLHCLAFDAFGVTGYTHVLLDWPLSLVEDKQ